MFQLKGSKLTYYWIIALPLGLSFFVGCAPVAGPTLNEVRSGQGRGQLPADTTLQPGEIRAEVIEIDPSRREIRVQTDDGRRQVLQYDSTNRTRVGYHGWDYNVDRLEPGDTIAFQPSPRDINSVDTIRIQEPVQTRPGAPVAKRLAAQRSPLPSRPNVIEGTVERIQYDLGVFEVRPATGRNVTVSIPYNAKAADVENFRRLRRGDPVRVEGEFVNSDNLQLLSFLAPR